MDLVIAAKGESVRPAVEEALAERLISFLDATTADPDLEDDGEGDGNADDEPSLGATEAVNHDKAWKWSKSNDPLSVDVEACDSDREGDDLDTKEACELEIYGESDSPNGGGTVDDEVSLGSLDGRISQKRWGLPDRDISCNGWGDLEHDDADPEYGGIDTDELEHDDDNGIADLEGLIEQTGLRLASDSVE